MYYQHGDALFHQRFNFFMVAESMLIVSFVTLYEKVLSYHPIGITICILGLIFTFTWLYTNARLYIRISYLIENYLKIYDPVYFDYIQVSVRGAYAGNFLSYVLPISTFLLWSFFLFYPFFDFILTALFISLIFSGLLLFSVYIKVCLSKTDY